MVAIRVVQRVAPVKRDFRVEDRTVFRWDPAKRSTHSEGIIAAPRSL